MDYHFVVLAFYFFIYLTFTPPGIIQDLSKKWLNFCILFELNHFFFFFENIKENIPEKIKLKYHWKSSLENIFDGIRFFHRNESTVSKQYHEITVNLH